MNIFFSKSKNKIIKQKGTSFLELFMILFVFSVLSSVVLVRFSSFGDSISLQLLSQNIALVLKRAQTEATSGKFTTSFSSNETPSYGVYFDLDTPKNFVYFYDRGSLSSKNRIFDSSNETIEQFTIDRSDEIVGLCIKTSSINCQNVNSLYITFTRPYLDAIIISPPSIPLSSADSVYEGQISIRSEQGITKKIIISRIGQIHVE